MGPPETIVGWTVFLALGAAGAVLGIAGRLRLGEAVVISGAVLACWAAFVFWLSAHRRSPKRSILTIEEVRHAR